MAQVSSNFRMLFHYSYIYTLKIWTEENIRHVNFIFCQITSLVLNHYFTLFKYDFGGLFKKLVFPTPFKKNILWFSQNKKIDILRRVRNRMNPGRLINMRKGQRWKHSNSMECRPACGITMPVIYLWEITLFRQWRPVQSLECQTRT